MEHWLVALDPEDGDAALDWAARHAPGRAGLEVIVSELEVSDPRAMVLRAADRLDGECADVPRALHVVPQFLPQELTRAASVDLVIMGSAGGPLSPQATERVLALLRVCRSPAVVVPRQLAGDPRAPRDVLWSAPRRRAPRAVVDAVRSGRETVRVVRSALPLQP